MYILSLYICISRLTESTTQQMIAKSNILYKIFFISKYQPFTKNCNLVPQQANFSKIQLKVLKMFLLITKPDVFTES